MVSTLRPRSMSQPIWAKVATMATPVASRIGAWAEATAPPRWPNKPEAMAAADSGFFSATLKAAKKSMTGNRSKRNFMRGDYTGAAAPVRTERGSTAERYVWSSFSSLREAELMQ